MMAATYTKSVFDIPLDEADEARLDAKAEAEIDAGKGVPHEKVREWLVKLGKGEKVPPLPLTTMRVIWSLSALREMARVFDCLLNFNLRAAL